MSEDAAPAPDWLGELSGKPAASQARRRTWWLDDDGHDLDAGVRDDGARGRDDAAAVRDVVARRRDGDASERDRAAAHLVMTAYGRLNRRDVDDTVAEVLYQKRLGDAERLFDEIRRLPGVSQSAVDQLGSQVELLLDHAHISLLGMIYERASYRQELAQITQFQDAALRDRLAASQDRADAASDRLAAERDRSHAGNARRRNALRRAADSG